MEWQESQGIRFLSHDLARSSVVFGSRVGGFSRPPFNSLNVGSETGDDADSVARNRIALSNAVGTNAESVVVARQVHGSDLIEHPSRIGRGEWSRAAVPEIEGDGHIVDQPGIGLAVVTADCLPIAIEGARGLALIHCGWRGLVAGIVPKAARRVRGERAVIGPGIGPCCYEVGEDVLARFPEEVRSKYGRRFDLVAVARDQMADAGIDEVAEAGICTSCASDDFFSFRRDGPVTGRQATVAWLN